MDSINFRNINAEKAKAIRNHRKLQKLSSLFFWVLEICLVLALVFTFLIQLPISLKNSCGYFKKWTLFIASPCFVFVLGNIIVIILCASSGQFAGRQYHTGKSSSSSLKTTDLYEEFIAKSENYEAKYGGKQGTNVEHVVREMSFHNNKYEEKMYQRDRYENSRGHKQNKSSSWEVKEKCMASVYSSSNGLGLDKVMYPEDNMSNEEFRCIIEAFIERQKKFRRNEENSVF